jgi:hypothetical protein
MSFERIIGLRREPSLGDTYENATLDAGWGATKLASFPDTAYLALRRAVPGGPPEELTDDDAPGYQRAAVPNDAQFWGPAANGRKANLTAIPFVSPLGPWPRITHWGLYDEAVDGNVIHEGAMQPVLLETGEHPEVPAGELILEAY